MKSTSGGGTPWAWFVVPFVLALAGVAALWWFAPDNTAYTVL
jgi:hypothetical protein